MVVCDCTARDQYLVAAVPTQIVWSLVNMETGELMLNGVGLDVLINYLNAERLQELEAE